MVKLQFEVNVTQLVSLAIASCGFVFFPCAIIINSVSGKVFVTSSLKLPFSLNQRSGSIIYYHNFADCLLDIASLPQFVDSRET
jgi:hypothetical protein